MPDGRDFVVRAGLDADAYRLDLAMHNLAEALVAKWRNISAPTRDDVEVYVGVPVLVDLQDVNGQRVVAGMRLVGN